MPKAHKFPLPSDYLKGDSLIFCPDERVIKIFNQHHGTDRKSMAKTVRAWFIPKAKELGWVDCSFLPIAQSPTKSAGCVLFHPNGVSIQQNAIMIILNRRLDS